MISGQELRRAEDGGNAAEHDLAIVPSCYFSHLSLVAIIPEMERSRCNWKLQSSSRKGKERVSEYPSRLGLAW
jgi:hypothetical protein